MGRKSVTVLPQTQAILEQLGEQIKTARLRRHLSAELVAQRAGVSRATVWNVEKGNPSVAIGIYAAVLHALNNMDIKPMSRLMCALPLKGQCSLALLSGRMESITKSTV